MRILLSLALASLFSASCLSDAGDASCSSCQASFSDAQCDAIAKSQGCDSGTSYVASVCQPATMGCQFKGCTPGRQIMCSIAEDMASTD
jgi:hypothetical protein